MKPLMSKKPRPSINDQLAEIAATSNVSTLQRDRVATQERENVGTLESDNIVSEEPSRDNVVTANEPVAGPDGYKRRVRYEKPHASVYAHPKVFKALREIAAAQDCKPHDLYLEGLRLVLKKHGRDFDTLNRGE
jgi:hypothetical protein